MRKSGDVGKRRRKEKREGEKCRWKKEGWMQE